MSKSAPKPYLSTEDEPVSQVSDIDFSLRYSYANYLNWIFEERVELIKGKVFKMSPAPSRIHQDISRNILLPLANFLKSGSCKVYSAPFDVRFPKGSKDDQDIYTVLQPDLCVICDPQKLDDKGCIGAPDLVVEILSMGSNKTELSLKYRIYEASKVKEYWVVSQRHHSLIIYTLDDSGKFQAYKSYTPGSKVTSSVLPGFEISLNDVFADC